MKYKDIKIIIVGIVKPPIVTTRHSRTHNTYMKKKENKINREQTFVIAGDSLRNRS